MSSKLVSLSLAALLAGTVALAGCTGVVEQPASPAAGQSQGKVTLRYLIEEQEDATALKAIEDMVGKFEASSGVDVKVESMPLENMRTVLQTQLRSGEGPDVFSWGSGPGFGGALAEADVLMDLTQAYSDYKWPVYDFAKKQVTFNGKIMGVPGTMETVGVFYNKDLFTKLGIAQPQNIADLKAAAEKVKAAGLIPIALGDKEGWEGGHLLSMALSSRVGSDGMRKLVSGEASWDSPDVVSALRTWSEFSDAGYLPKSPTSLTYDAQNALFLTQKAAMVPTGSWFVDGIQSKAKFQAGYIPFPSDTSAGIFSAGLGSGPYVAKTTQHPKESLDFVNFLTSPEYGKWEVEALSQIPPYPVDTTGLKVSPLFQQVLSDTAKMGSGGGDMGLNIDVLMSDQFNDAMTDGIQGLLTHQKTPEQVAAALQAAAAKK
jgi:raffinose/stachyose/melibiose transport system substrate-binding protein